MVLKVILAETHAEERRHRAQKIVDYSEPGVDVVVAARPIR